LRICMEVQRPARIWARTLGGKYRVSESNGKEVIELVEAGSRWLIAAQESVYGYSVSLAGVDEAWKVRPQVVEEGLEPTMVEREQAQLLLVSTAHRLATSLMLGRRGAALDALETGDGSLLLEWSAPPGSDLEDVAAWRQASSHWSPRRERTIRQHLEAAQSGTLRDPDEPDPVASFRSQWLNQWPATPASMLGNAEPLLPAGLWADRAVEGLVSSGPIWWRWRTITGRTRPSPLSGCSTTAGLRLMGGGATIGIARSRVWSSSPSSGRFGSCWWGRR